MPLGSPGDREELLGATDISVALGGLPVLRGINLSVHAGEAVALLGGNGSGKSTLIRALLGLVPIQRGSVFLFGTPLRAFRNWSKLGYVPQSSTVGLSRAKVKEVVASGRLSHRPAFLPPGRTDREAVTEALTIVGLLDRSSDELSTLSGGQQQRVLIARALVGRPQLLVLDEPVAGVDLEQQRILTDVLAKLIERGTAVLVVLHEVGPLASLIQRAIVLRQGRVIHDGDLPPSLIHDSSAPADDHDHSALGGHEHGAGKDEQASPWLENAVDCVASNSHDQNAEQRR